MFALISFYCSVFNGVLICHPIIVAVTIQTKQIDWCQHSSHRYLFASDSRLFVLSVFELVRSSRKDHKSYICYWRKEGYLGSKVQSIYSRFTAGFISTWFCGDFFGPNKIMLLKKYCPKPLSFPKVYCSLLVLLSCIFSSWNN